MQIKNMMISQFMAVMLMATLGCPYAAAAQRLTPLPHPVGVLQQPLFQANVSNSSSSSASPWTPLTNQPSFLVDGAANPILLTDGTVLVQDAGFPDWWRLTPDQHGSYVNGTWTQVASLPATYSPLYHSSAVLPDGRLIIEGGEYLLSLDQSTLVPTWSAQGSIYDPIANIWTPVAPPPFFSVIEVVPGVFGQTIGDAQSVVLANGTYMQADCCTKQQALLNAKTLTWEPTGKDKFDPNDEEGWTLLANGKVLAVDAYVPIAPFPYMPDGTNSELYNPATGSWSSAGSTKVQLWDSQAACGGETNATFELGPGVLRSDGTVFYTGSNTCANGIANTAIYNSYSGRWTPGPVFPVVDGITDLNIADGPASWEPNDKVLMMASPGFGNPPSVFFEWDGRQLNQVPGPPNAPIDGSFFGNMLVLPTGQILLTDFSDDIEIYTPSDSRSDQEQQQDIAPIVFAVPETVQRGHSYQIFGIRFNGTTQGAAYGDDVQGATNYPLVRITNLKTSHVFYARTHDHSSMAVASNALVNTHFDVSKAQEPGLSILQVVANGIASQPEYVIVK
jgi:hypothetical protein